MPSKDYMIMIYQQAQENIRDLSRRAEQHWGFYITVSMGVVAVSANYDAHLYRYVVPVVSFVLAALSSFVLKSLWVNPILS